MRASDKPTPSYDVRYDVINDSIQTANDAQRLLAELCHDVRQPLTTIRMNLQAIVRLVDQAKASPETSAALDALHDCLDAEQELDTLFTGVNHLIRRILESYSRTELNSVALDAVRLYRVLTRAGRKIQLHLADPSPVVHGNASRLRYAVRTLLRHGLVLEEQCAPAERLVVATRQASSYAELSVSGLPLPLVFGRAQSTPLTITTLIARAHGGITRIESCDSAATVRIVLPGAAPRSETFKQSRP